MPLEAYVRYDAGMTDLRYWKNPENGLISALTATQAGSLPGLVEVDEDAKPTHPLFVRPEGGEQANIERLSHAEITEQASLAGVEIPATGTLAERREALAAAIAAFGNAETDPEGTPSDPEED